MPRKKSKAGSKKREKQAKVLDKVKKLQPQKVAPPLPQPDDFEDRPLTDEDMNWVKEHQQHLLFLADLHTDELVPQTKKSRREKMMQMRKQNAEERESRDDDDDDDEEGSEDGEGEDSDKKAPKKQQQQQQQLQQYSEDDGSDFDGSDDDDDEGEENESSLEAKYAKSLGARKDLIGADTVEKLPVKTDRGQIVRRVEEVDEAEEELKEKKRREREVAKAKAKLEGEKILIQKTQYDAKGNVIPERKKRTRDEANETKDEKSDDVDMDDELEILAAEEEESGPQSKRQRKERVNFRTATYDDVKQDPVMRQKRLDFLKQRIAAAAIEILTDPMKNIEQFDTVLRLCSDSDPQLANAAIISAMALFKDIIPAYRIRLETGEKLSKEIKALRYYEENLLKNYQLYLSMLYSHVVENKKHSVHREISIRCICDLLVHAPHFNFRTNILIAITQNMNSKIDKISEICYDGICALFANDTTNQEASLEAVETLTKYICDHGYEVNPRMIDCFLSLRLDHVLTDSSVPSSYSFTQKLKDARKAKLKPHNNNKKRRIGADDEEAEAENFSKELAAADATNSFSDRKQHQITMLRNIVVCYVRLLKNKPDSQLLYCALAGLAKFANLMNIELLYDLLVYLRVVISMDGLPPTTLLQCIVTVQNLLSGHGEALDIDIKEFYSHLYRIIPITLTSAYNERDARLLVDALYTMLLRPKTLPVQRVAAFVKRILTYAVTAHSHVAVALIELSRMLCRRYRSLEQMFSAESSGLGSYKPDADDPDHVNPLATALWEYDALAMHYQPHVSKLALSELAAFNDVGSSSIGYSHSGTTNNRTLSKMRTREDMQKILDKFDPFVAQFHPSVKLPGPHPLQEMQLKINKKLAKASSKARKSIKKHVFIRVSQVESKFVQSVKQALKDAENQNQPQQEAVATGAAVAPTNESPNGGVAAAAVATAANGAANSDAAKSKKKSKGKRKKKQGAITAAQ